MAAVQEAKRQRKGSYRGKRSPVGILQAVLLANALSARHPPQCHDVPTHHCQSSPVEHVVNQCRQVSAGPRVCEQVPVEKCHPVPRQQCRQVCV